MKKDEILLKLKNHTDYIKEIEDCDNEFKLFIIKNNGTNI